MVITTGRIIPSWLWVCALKLLQNSMMLTPCCPSAGPTGGEGFAFPAGSCSFTCATTFFMRVLLRLLDLREFQLHRRRAAEDAHQDPELALVGADLLDDPGEVRERPVRDPDALPLLELHLRARLRGPLG